MVNMATIRLKNAILDGIRYEWMKYLQIAILWWGTAGCLACGSSVADGAEAVGERMEAKVSSSMVSGAAHEPAVRLTRNIVDESAGNLPCFRIDTPAAIYYIETTGAGLSSLIDRDGNDWIGFHPEPGSGAGGEYRGFPNAVHRQDGSYFHPMNEGTDPSTVEAVFESPERVTLRAASESNTWLAQWDFYPTHCTFSLLKMPAGHRYWILYEGAPGGGYDDTDWWMTSASDRRQPLTVPHDGDIPDPEWIAFGDPAVERTLALLHHQDDSHPDRFYQMEHKMTVFGFGRAGLTKFLDSVPRRFSIGFLETTHPQVIAEHMERWQKDLYRETVEAPSGDKRTIMNTEGLVAFWDFGEPAKQSRLSSGPTHPHPLRETHGPIERVEGGPFSGYAAELNGSNWFRIPYEETGDLNIGGPNAEVSMIAFVKLKKVEKTTVAGMWSEGKGARDDTGTRQYALLLDMPMYGGSRNVTPHVSSEGGVTRRADGSAFPWCVDYAASVSTVPVDEWVSLGFTYDGNWIKAFYNGVFEPRPLRPEEDGRTDRYFTREGPDGGDRGMNPYYHGRGIFRFDPTRTYDPPKIDPPDFTIGARYAVGSYLKEAMRGSIGGLAVFNRSLSDEEMLTLHRSARLERLR